MSSTNSTAEPDPSDGLAGLLAGYAELVRAELVRHVHGADDLAPFYGMMAYHLGWVDRRLAPIDARAGKSLRPALCLLLAEGLGASRAECAPLAAGIELLHNFSLVHDDIQDRSPTRRGRAAVWTIWGEAQAINVGDALFSLAHQLWLRAPIAERDPAAGLAILRSLESTVVALCEGQYLDISGEGSLGVSSAAYMNMIGRKTAALIGEAAWVGARVATAEAEVLSAARAFGRELGMAFQIRDDLLGIWGDERETGKSASSDIATRKMTLPVILALETGTPAVLTALRDRYGVPPREDNDEARVRDLLVAAGADTLAAAQEENHWRAAMGALAQLPLSPPWREHLGAFARLFVARKA